jgi:hypothetical protein
MLCNNMPRVLPFVSWRLVYNTGTGCLNRIATAALLSHLHHSSMPAGHPCLLPGGLLLLQGAPAPPLASAQGGVRPLEAAGTGRNTRSSSCSSCHTAKQLIHTSAYAVARSGGAQTTYQIAGSVSATGCAFSCWAVGDMRHAGTQQAVAGGAQ